MIFGYLMSTVGYAIMYWGIHHFPVVDGGKRYSLLDCLGIPQSWGIIKGQPVQLNLTGNQPAPPAKGTQSPPATGSGSTGAKNAPDYGVPGAGGSTLGGSSAKGGPTPGCWNLVKLPNYGGWAWKQTGTNKVSKTIVPPGGGKPCKGTLGQITGGGGLGATGKSGAGKVNTKGPWG